MLDWIKRRGQAILEVFEFDFWEWLFLTPDGRATIVSALTLIAGGAGKYLSPAWAQRAVGAFIASVVILVPSLLLRVLKKKTAAASQPIAVETSRDEIRFDYLPDSPLAHGWKSAGWAKHPIPTDAAWEPTSDGGMLMKLSDIYCPIVYQVGTKAALSRRLVCDLTFLTGAELFVLVRLTRDGSDDRDGGIKFELSRRQPSYTAKYDEWVLPIDPPSLGNGRHHLDISLTDSVGRTWGQAGWKLSELLKIRIRGHLSISPFGLR
jgi:hypothetical protein